MNEDVPVVTVLLSAYNGESYLREQVESVLSQQGVDVRLIVRDDGSADGSVGLVTRLSAAHPDAIELIHSEGRLGSAESFLELTRRVAGTSEWYAYCDQDDVWLPGKLSRAVGLLGGLKSGRGRLYTSATTICDRSLNVLAENTFPGLRLELGAEFARHRLPGHTMVFDDSLLGALNSVDGAFGFPHDHLLCSVACASGASIVFDSESRVLHRRVESSVTPGGNGLRKRVSHELGLIRNARGLDRHGLAEELLRCFSEGMRTEDAELLGDIMEGKQIRLLGDLRSGKLSTGLRFGDVETAVSIILGVF